MKIALASDWHLGMTQANAIQKQLKKMQAEKPDVLLQLGDFCGGMNGAKSVKSVLTMVREAFPNTPILAVLGNHDFWYRDTEYRRQTTSITEFFSNYTNIVNTMKDLGIHFFDEDGIYRQDGWTFLGHTLWYGQMNPPTNDTLYLPRDIEGSSPHVWMQARGYNAVSDQVDQLTVDDTNVIFCSHFPIINFSNDNDYLYGGNPAWGKVLVEIGVQYLFNGHAHQRHEGPLRFEAGSDYYLPKYLIANL